MTRLSTRQAIIVRELVRAGGGYVTVSQLADALGYGEEVWQPYISRKSSNSPLAHHRVHAHIGQIRRKFGKEIIEGFRGSCRGTPSMGYRLTRQGWDLIGMTPEEASWL